MIERSRQLKRDRDQRCKALKAANGAVLSFHAEQIGLIGDLLVDCGRLPQWDCENRKAIHAALAVIVRDELGIPEKATRRQDEIPDVPSFEPADTNH